MFGVLNGISGFTDLGISDIGVKMGGVDKGETMDDKKEVKVKIDRSLAAKFKALCAAREISQAAAIENLIKEEVERSGG